ncbi:MAG: hypothetical protein WC548_03965 [Candidatus Pacearchaeota archaeon]
MVKRIIGYTWCLVLIILLFLLCFVIADLASNAGGPYNVNESVTQLYNFTINNTHASANFTQVNVTFSVGFIVNVTSNGTSSIGNFSISSDNLTLSWTNTSGIVRFNTTKYFWINATANSTAVGTSNITILTNDTNFKTNTTNVTVTVNDTTGPVISVLSPLNGTTYATSTVWFNATADETISAWVVNFNETNITLSAINTSLAIANGVYNLSFYANDSAGNWGVNNSFSFTVSVPIETTTTTSTGGKSPNSYLVSEFSLARGYLRILKADQQLNLTLRGEKHLLKINEVNSSGVLIIVESAPQIKFMAVGEEWKIDVDNDGKFYDLALKLEKIISGRAQIHVISINEEIPALLQVSNNSSVVQSGETSPQSISRLLVWILIIILIIMVIAVVVIFASRFKNRKYLEIRIRNKR